MCEYCEFGKLDNVNHMARQEVAVNIGGIEHEPWVLMAYLHRHDHGGYSLDTEFVMFDDNPVAMTSVEIEYCPFCGEKLR